MRNKIDLRKLPPLNALKGFEATTRRESVREAAEELCLTHPAVSYQIQVLEQDLGVPLFSRTGRALVPTEEGRLLYKYVRQALELLIEGTESVRRTRAGSPLRVQTYVTASIRWLARKLPEFVASHPDIRLQLSTCAFEWEFDDSIADVGLVYCDTPPAPEYHWVPLFDYTLAAVSSPELAKKLGPAPTPGDLLEFPLVEIYSEPHNWDIWFEAAQLPYLTTPCNRRGHPGGRTRDRAGRAWLCADQWTLRGRRPGSRSPGATGRASSHVPGRLGPDLPAGSTRQRAHPCVHGLDRQAGSAHGK